MTDTPYTEEDLDIAERAVSKALGGMDEDRTTARYVLDALTAAGWHRGIEEEQ